MELVEAKKQTLPALAVKPARWSGDAAVSESFTVVQTTLTVNTQSKPSRRERFALLAVRS